MASSHQQKGVDQYGLNSSQGRTVMGTSAMMNCLHKYSLQLTWSAPTSPMMTTFSSLTMLAHTQSEQRMLFLHIVSEKTLPLGSGAVLATEKGGGKLEVLQVRFKAGCSPARVCVGIPVLGTKLGQYTLSDLNSLLANSLSYGSAKRIGCTDGARRALGH